MSSTSKSVLRIVTVAGLLSLFHCAYSAAQHRFYLRLTEQPFTQLPADLIIQTLVSLVAVVYGASYVAGDFLPVRTDLQNRAKSWDTVGNCPSFYTFDHRAKALSPSYSAFSRDFAQDVPKFSPSYSTVRCFATAPSTHRTSPDFSQLPGGRSPRTLREPQRASARPAFSNEAAKDALDHCVISVKNRDFANYIATLLMPSAAQSAIFALLAFNVELAVVRDQIKRYSGTAGIYRLQFWKDTLGTIYENKSSLVPRQPVAIGLSVFAKKASLSLLQELVSSRQATLGDRPFGRLEDVSDYGKRTHGTLTKLLINELSSPVEGLDSLESTDVENACKAADLMGSALGILTLLRSTIPLLSRGIVLLPDDLMNIHGVTADLMFTKKRPEDTESLTRAMAEKSVSFLAESRNLRDKVPTRLRLALMANGATADFLLKTLEKSNYNLYDARLQRGYDLLAWRLWWRKLRSLY